MPDNSKVFDGLKFMWDGKVYDSEGDAKKVEDEYSKEGFEVKVVPEEDKFVVYTRRVVTEVVVEGAPPP